LRFPGAARGEKREVSAHVRALLQARQHDFLDFRDLGNPISGYRRERFDRPQVLRQFGGADVVL
jgi:hypothetical protein